MTPTIVLPDGDPHMAALLSRPDFAARLDRLGGARLHADLPKDDDELIERIADATVVILGAYLTGPVLRRLPALEFISFTGTGAATFVDLPAAAECGIAVANVAHYGDAAVAEHALALALALAKGVVPNDRAGRAGEWHVGQGIELAGKTAGIIGYGGIGARLAGLLEAIGMRVVVWTPRPEPARLISPAQRFVELHELLKQADVVSLHLLLTDETRGMIDEPMLRSMKPGALLVNTARAELIAPGALERASPRTRATTPRRAWSACSPRAGSRLPWTSSTPSRSRPAPRSATCRTWSSPPTRATTRRRAWSACSTSSSPTSRITSRAHRPTLSPPLARADPIRRESAILCHWQLCHLGIEDGSQPFPTVNRSL
jgi:phosphoglycerate dehydrogenase-like enzyme